MALQEPSLLFLLGFLTAQNKKSHTRLWRVFISTVEKKGKLLTIGIDDLSKEAIKRRNCPINWRFGNIPLYVHREGGKPTEISKRIGEAMEAKGQNRAGK